MKFNWKLEDKSVCYKRLKMWWDEHDAFGSNHIPYNSVPNRVFTVSVDLEDGEVDLYSVAIIITDTDICWVGWITSNPFCKETKYKVGALKYLYNIISIVMKSQGFESIVSHAKLSGLMNALENSGFELVEPQTNFYIKNL
tara:strand:- start:3996 stop:4418 length:423 start_codon:yes stop_codon:yes gene_type:complete